MNRRIIAPFQFGANEGYDLASGTQVEVSGLDWHPHYDYCLESSLYYSFRIWEPYRGTVSNAGFATATGGGNAIFKPGGVTIHGIKGAMHFMFSPRVQSGGTFYILGDDGYTQVPLGEPGNHWLSYFQGGEESNAGWHEGTGLNPRWVNPLVYAQIPVFVSMFKGTYQPGADYTEQDDGSSWIIDTGPPDDPDTLLGVDISSPGFLEQDRVVWWDMFWAKLPVNRFLPSAAEDLDGDQEFPPAAGTQSTGPCMVHYPLNMDRNWRLSEKQVLWLMIQVGNIWLPNIFGWENPQMEVPPCVLYRGHNFSIGLHASALTSGPGD